MKSLALILLLASLSFAGERFTGEFKEVRLTDGTVLKEVVVTKVLPTILYLTHKNGITKVPKEELPADVMAKYAAAFEEAEKAAAQRKERLAADGLKVKVLAKEGVGFFRYFLTGCDLTGKGCTGTLSVSYATKDAPFGSGTKEAAFKAGPDGDGFAAFDWVPGPSGPLHRMGVSKVQWTLTTDDGRRFRGVASVPWNTEGRVPPEDVIKEVRLTDGTVLEEVGLRKVTATSLDLVHKNGVARIPKEKLPADLLTKYAAAFEEAQKEAAEWERDRPLREQHRALSAVYSKKGGGVTLSEALVKELNELLERCPEEPVQYDPKGGCVYYGLPEKWIKCNTNKSWYSIDIKNESLGRRVVPEELKPRVEEFCRKLDQHWSASIHPATSKKKKRRITPS
ncbi:MAG TPA: hypothetical protein VG796_22080 [Verrucomicrobiales bacterium]|nr:hypothetical protein [Verrucomicrobiales bacterium]